MALSKNQSFLFDKNEQWQVMSCPATKQMSSVSHEQSKQKWQVAVSMSDVIDNMAIGNGSNSPGKPVTFVSSKYDVLWQKKRECELAPNYATTNRHPPRGRLLGLRPFQTSKKSAGHACQFAIG